MSIAALIEFAVETSMDLGTNPRLWTKAEDAFIRENITGMTMEELGQHLGRTETAIDVYMKRRGIAGVSRQPGWYTTNKVAKLLCVDSHSITRLCEKGILNYTRLPGLAMTKSVRKISIWVWAINPENWIYFNIRRVRDARLRRLIELRRERWKDEWWTTGQVAEYFGLTSSGTVDRAILEGKLRGTQWGNWHVKRSDALAHRFHPGKGSSRADPTWTAGAWEFLVRAREEWGLEFKVIARMMKRTRKNVEYKYRMYKKGEIAGSIERCSGVLQKPQNSPG